MKKIVFLSGETDIKGGGEFSLIDVISNLKDDYELLCVCKEEGPLADALRREGIRILFCDLKWPRKFRWVFDNYKRLFKLSAVLKKLHPDLLYANAGHLNPFAVRLARRLKVPLITHVRDIFNQPRRDKYCFGKTDRIITCSDTVAGLVRVYNRNVKAVYNGIDPQKFTPALRQEKDSLKNRLNLNGCFLLGNIGTITYKKGFFEFVRAAKKIRQEIGEARFLIIGEAKREEAHILEELKQKISEAGLQDAFIFTGFIRPAEQAVAALDVLFFPSYYEAFGRVIIEAFACKTPVISTRSGGPEEIIENKKDGFLFKSNDIEGMAEAAVRLHKDRELYKRITEKAYQKFLANFTIDKTVKEIKKVIEQVIA